MVSQSSLDALTIEVFSTDALVPEDPNSPIEYSADTTAYPEVTAGKRGGVAG